MTAAITSRIDNSSVGTKHTTNGILGSCCAGRMYFVVDMFVAADSLCGDAAEEQADTTRGCICSRTPRLGKRPFFVNFEMLEIQIWREKSENLKL